MDRRVPLAHLPTPLEPMDRLGAALGFAPGHLLVKRDDCTGLAGGGNKARKLEYITGAAIDAGADILVTGGGRQSNHARMTAAAANRMGLGCTLVLGSEPDPHPTGNVILDHLLGTRIVWAGDLDYYGIEAAIAAECDRLEAAGGKPYAIPTGGASPEGVLGYLHAARELRLQAPDLGLVVVADGSGGTHAGMVAGLGDHGAVLGVNVGTRPDLDQTVPAMAAAAAARVGLAPPTGQCVIDHDHTGPGYGAPTDAAREALDLAARLEGLILDPVYTGKAMAGLIARVRDGRIDRRQRVVFVHTGGLPALFTPRYVEWIGQQPTA